jgi:O-antigen/teichoic acid export membrane protein
MLPDISFGALAANPSPANVAAAVPDPPDQKPSLVRLIGRTSVLSVISVVASGLAGILIARYLGATVRGRYAAVTAWFGFALIAGELGQPAALCYYVARQPRRARDHLCTSRATMVVSGCAVAVGGFFLAIPLARGNADLVFGYRVVFGLCPLAFVSGAYSFALQGRHIRRWAVVTTTQPLTYLVLVAGLRAGGRLTLRSVLVALAVSVAVQAVVGRQLCARSHLLGGRVRRPLTRPLLAYGLSQLLATTPTTINTTLDQLVLSQAVAARDLGRYAVAVSLTSLALPVVAPIGYVLFPMLARGRDSDQAGRSLERRAILTAAVLSSGAMLLLCLGSPLIPDIFGTGFRPAIHLVWILAPSGVFLTCNQVMGDLLRGRGAPLSVAWGQGIGAVATVVLLVALVPVMGVRGAAIASTVSYAVTSLVLLRALTGAPPGAEAQR